MTCKMACEVCKHPFKWEARFRSVMVRCPRCGRLQFPKDEKGGPPPPPAPVHAGAQRVQFEYPTQFLAVKARATCGRCHVFFEHEQPDTTELKCPRCKSSAEVRRLLGRIFVVPDGVEEVLHPRLKKWLRVLRKHNDWVTVFERHAGALSADARNVGLAEGDVAATDKFLKEMKAKVESMRDAKIEEFRRYLSAFEKGTA